MEIITLLSIGVNVLLPIYYVISHLIQIHNHGISWPDVTEKGNKSCWKIKLTSFTYTYGQNVSFHIVDQSISFQNNPTAGRFDTIM